MSSTAQIKLRRGTAAQWTAAAPVLALGEIGLETDTQRFKAGDGTTAWAGLPYYGTSSPVATTSGLGISRLATQNEVNTGTAADLVVTPLTLTNWSGRLRRASTSVGDGLATSYAITHNFNTRDVIVRVFPNSGQFDDVEVDVQRTTVNTVTVVFATAPAANAYRIVVIG